MEMKFQLSMEVLGLKIKEGSNRPSALSNFGSTIIKLVPTDSILDGSSQCLNNSIEETPKLIKRGNSQIEDMYYKTTNNKVR